MKSMDGFSFKWTKNSLDGISLESLMKNLGHRRRNPRSFTQKRDNYNSKREDSPEEDQGEDERNEEYKTRKIKNQKNSIKCQ